MFQPTDTIFRENNDTKYRIEKNIFPHISVLPEDGVCGLKHVYQYDIINTY
jgi:hypothetical protein